MKLRNSYIGDSSDGEEQCTEERDLVNSTKSYTNHLNNELLNDDFRCTFIFKDIGGRLLHHKSVTKKYFKIKTSYKIPKTEVKLIDLANKIKVTIQKAALSIADKYILGHFVSNRNKLFEEVEQDYFASNQTNIHKFIKKKFPRFEEEAQFISALRVSYVKYNNQDLPMKFEQDLVTLYRSIIDKWDEPKELATLFEIQTGKRTKFAKKLKSSLSKDTLEAIVTEYESSNVRRDLTEDPEQQIYYFLTQSYVEERQTVRKLLEYGISHLNFFAATEDGTNATGFLANIKAYHKFMRGIIKDILIDRDTFKIDGTVVVCPIGTAVYKDPDNPALGTITIYEQNKIYSSGARSSKVLGSTGKLDGTYDKLLPDIRTIGQKVNLSVWFKAILKGDQTILDTWNESFSLQELHYLYDLTFLLFSCETTRNVGAFLTTPMFFDLVSCGAYSIDDIASKLPIAMEKAVPSSIKAIREFKAKYGETNGYLSSVLHYDYRLNISGFDMKTLNDRNEAILYNWLIYYKMGINKDSVIKQQLFTAQSSIAELEAALGNGLIIDVDDKDKTIGDYTDKFMTIQDEYEEYQIKLKVTLDADDDSIKRTKFEVDKVPAVAFRELIQEWYGLDMPYLDGEILLKGNASLMDMGN